MVGKGLYKSVLFRRHESRVPLLLFPALWQHVGRSGSLQPEPVIPESNREEDVALLCVSVGAIT